MRHLLIFFTIVFVWPASAQAACWKLKTGQVIEGYAGSSPPVAGARIVSCPKGNLPNVAKPSESAKLGVVTTKLGTGTHSDNCVFFARSKVKNLPTGMLDWNGKTAAINSKIPQQGSVAMIPYGNIGHVAYVEKVTGNQITIIEANFSSGIITRRVSTGKDIKDAEAQLKIVGYYRP